VLGQTNAAAPNAQTTQMTAVFWIETVEEVIKFGPFKVGDSPILRKATPSIAGQRVATFSAIPPHDLDKEIEIRVRFTQIQYTQTVLLFFAGLIWPHVSVNTLMPADDIVVPPSVWK
jgi:hypothetical protein